MESLMWATDGPCDIQHVYKISLMSQVHLKDALFWRRASVGRARRPLVIPDAGLQTGQVSLSH